MASNFGPSRSVNGLPNSANQNGIDSRQVQLASRPVPVVDLPALQSASRVLQDQFIKDAQIIPDLGDTLTTRM